MTGVVFIGAIFLMMVVVAIAVVAFALTRRQSPASVTFPTMRETPQQILDRRFAAGDITAEQYKQARDLLGREVPT